MRLNRCYLLLLALLLCGIAKSQESPIIIPAKMSTSVEDFILVPVEVNGKAFWCNLDSGGSSVFSLDAKKGAAAGFKPDGVGHSAGAGPEVVADQRMHGATVRIGSVPLADRTIIMRSFPEEIPEMDCVMGVSLLKAYVVEIDYVTPQVRLFTAGQFRPDSTTRSIPFRIERSNPIGDIAIVFDDSHRVTASVILDTGAAYYSAALTAAFIGKNNVRTPALKTARPVNGSDGGFSISAIRAARIEAGSSRTLAPVVGLIESQSAGLPWDGVLGTGFFRQFTATFDYGSQILFLKPNSRFGEHQPFDGSGLGVRKDSGGKNYVVATILPDTAASSADLRKGDVLVSIDGVEASKLTPAEIRRLLSGSDVRRILKAERSGKVHQVPLLLHERL